MTSCSMLCLYTSFYLITSTSFSNIKLVKILIFCSNNQFGNNIINIEEARRNLFSGYLNKNIENERLTLYTKIYLILKINSTQSFYSVRYSLTIKLAFLFR